MKSPEDCRRVLAKQWESPTFREDRLLGGQDAWPIRISIGRPSSKLLASELDTVKRHVEAWRKVTVGNVLWKKVRYRVTGSEVEVPAYWQLSKPTEWIDAIRDKQPRSEFEAMARWVEHSHPSFHRLMVRKRSLWRDKSVEDVLQALSIAEKITPGCADAKPLRTMGLFGVDTKFFERNARLILELLDERFEGEASRIGLEDFLGAYRESEHWLLVYDLDGGLLPFRRMRLRSVDLQRQPLPGRRILLIENESCVFHLPDLEGTVAVLGSGFDLNWTDTDWLRGRSVAYWGDIDTWGLVFLAKARQSLPQLTPLLMTSELFEIYEKKAVREPVTAGIEPPPGLMQAEQILYEKLVQSQRGRLEQELLSREDVHAALQKWWGDC